jgi:diguanylate cyclase (GGDEF)-like protein/PAS domain S-box-containing protein
MIKLPSAQPIERTLKRARLALVTCSLLFLLLLTWFMWDRMQTRFEQERVLARHVTAAVAKKLALQLQAIGDELQSFAYRERDLLVDLARAPRSPVLTETLWALIQLTFPGVDSAQVFNSYGTRLAVLGDGPVELEGWVMGGHRSTPSLRLRHSANRDGIRTRYAAPWFAGNQPAGTLLIDLPCEHLCLQRPPKIPTGHRLDLRSRSRGGGASETPEAGGGAGSWLATAPVEDTDWVVEARLDPAQLRAWLGPHLLVSLGLMALLLAAVAVLYRWVERQSRDDLKEILNLRESRDQVQALLETTTDGIILTEPRGRILFLNPAAELTFGRLAEDTLNASVETLLPEVLSQETARPFLEASQSAPASPAIIETWGRSKEGKQFPVRLSLSILQIGGSPHLLIVVQDLTEAHRNEQKLVFLEQRDVLTGLLNRTLFERRLAGLLADERHDSAGPHTLCHIDVDQFKLINDTCGHEAGDELLKQIAILVEAKFEGAEIIARLGSDEFGALLRDQPVEEARAICEAFMQTVRHFLFTWRDQSFDIAVSIGMIAFTPESETASTALSKADVACQMAKTHGRDRIHVYQEDDAELARHHGDMRLVSTISQALSDGRFRLYAQPIAHIAARPGHQHFEILVRMEDESGTAMIPDDFIPAAERYILMPSVDRWIINRLFSLQAENLRTWHQLEPDGFLFAVNLSGTSINDESFIRYLKRQFRDWNVPHASICFEITETAAVSNLEGARAFMEELSALGCSFALDDFGTGLSSYRYLKELPVDYLKIDGSFVRGMTEDPVSYALVESINQIGHVLRLKTIAEWAEDKGTLNQLRALNVDFAQGYGVGQPVPVSELDLTDMAVTPAPDSHDHERPVGTHRTRSSAA